ncbi:homoserine kinase [Schizosaccharomyces japonicus yFS275]|uniref:Homoserine kinase n=1 Tax=Schizosaccharomyces japonicus (strain yFS275 / FY16936) TaxID=402676 RepID=B6K3F7_SCHJY|nr:homoserine kinase [Schizosaccharomyces japonicus yFS275]EEB08014.1 homoserine kinase [Schizosaccharomyces japonicus yFS275]
MAKFQISVPASSANIGPGFDVLGLSLDYSMTVDVETSSGPGDFVLTYEGDSADSVSTKPSENMVTQVALYVLRCNGMEDFPVGVRAHVKNPIPLGRGMGSSASAAIAGVMLANEVAKLGLSKDEMMDYVLMLERHPDNVMAAMMGGLVASFLRELSEEERKAFEPSDDDLLKHRALTIPPKKLASYFRFPWNPDMKAIVVIPEFHLATSKARSVLPQTYSRADAIFNLQRLVMLTAAIGQSPVQADVVCEAMQDKLHQPYRASLVPGLTEIINTLKPENLPGVCGSCLSGAGPTVLALATANFEKIAETMVGIFKKNGINCRYLVLSPAFGGASVTYSS